MRFLSEFFCKRIIIHAIDSPVVFDARSIIFENRSNWCLWHRNIARTLHVLARCAVTLCVFSQSALATKVLLSVVNWSYQLPLNLALLLLVPIIRSKEFTCQIWFGLRWRNIRFRNITFSPRYCEREVAGEANKPVEFKQLKYKIWNICWNEENEAKIFDNQSSWRIIADWKLSHFDWHYFEICEISSCRQIVSRSCYIMELTSVLYTSSLLSQPRLVL